MLPSDLVIHSSNLICSQAKYITVNESPVEQVQMFYKAHKEGNISPSQWKKYQGLFIEPFQNKEDDIIQWIFIIDCLNFSFWSDQTISIEYNNQLYNGYKSLCAAITKAYTNGIPILNADFLQSITLDDMQSIFQSKEGHIIPMINERTQILNEAGRVLNEHFSGHFKNVVLQSSRSAQQLILLVLKYFTSYRDEAIFEGKPDIWGCFEGNGIGRFDDIDSITMFADYRVPQALVYFKLLQYSPELMERLTSGELFTPGELMELEIRAGSIKAVEVIKKEMKKLFSENDLDRSPINSILIDFYLWDYAKAHHEEMKDIPIHKIRTIYY